MSINQELVCGDQVVDSDGLKWEVISARIDEVCCERIGSKEDPDLWAFAIFIRDSGGGVWLDKLDLEVRIEEVL